MVPKNIPDCSNPHVFMVVNPVRKDDESNFQVIREDDETAFQVLYFVENRNPGEKLEPCRMTAPAGSSGIEMGSLEVMTKEQGSMLLEEGQISGYINLRYVEDVRIGSQETSW